MRTKARALQWLLLLCLTAFVVQAAACDPASVEYDATYALRYLHKRGYAETMGVTADTWLWLSGWEAALGAPRSEERTFDAENDRTLHTVRYPQTTLYCVVKETDSMVAAIEVTDPALRFGVLGVGVGSPRAAVQLAYLTGRRLPAESLSQAPFYEAELGYDGDRWMEVLFCFDAQDRVERMWIVPDCFG